MAEQFFVERKGAGYEVVKTSDHGSVWRVGIFSTKENAIFWIKDQKNSSESNGATHYR